MKRRIVIITLLLLAGAIINVAVAWGCAACVRRVNFMTNQAGNETTWKTYSESRDTYTEFTEFPLRALGVELTWLIAGQRIERQYAVSGHFIWRAGLPLKSLEADGPGVPTSTMQPGIILNVPIDLGLGFARLQTRCLPGRPLWSGFAINTIFYAAIVWMLFAVPGAVRRRVRIKRGVCVHCAYPVGSSSTCSECGKAVHGASPPATPN